MEAEGTLNAVDAKQDQFQVHLFGFTFSCVALTLYILMQVSELSTGLGVYPDAIIKREDLDMLAVKPL